MDGCDPSPAGTEEPWRSQEGFLVFSRCYSQPQLSTGWSKDGLKHPQCAPSSELGSGLLLKAVTSTGALGPSRAPWAELHRSFLC